MDHFIEMKEILSGLEAETYPFALSFDVPIDLMNIHIKNMGHLVYPYPKEILNQILKMAQDSRFGYQEETRLDKTVRRSKEIPAAELEVEFKGSFLPDLMEQIRKNFGYDDNAQFIPHLYNLLMYEPGDFFKPHQDTEKVEGMIATMLLILPTPHIGGSLSVSLDKDTLIFQSENLDSSHCKVFVFYADCKHEVKTLKQGHRLALTYNLALKNPICELVHENKRLTNLVHDCFDSREGIGANKDHIVYLLNHEYTKHSLRWNLLKGADAVAAKAFMAAAHALDLDCYLVLSKVHQVWTAEQCEDERDHQTAGEDLIDCDYELNFWVDSSNNVQPFDQLYIDNDDILNAEELLEREPTETEYEGYTGNAGCTMEYWYKMGAIILWPKSKKFLMLSKIYPEGTLLDIKAWISNPEHHKHLIKNIGVLGQGVHQVLPANKEESVLLLLQIALLIDNRSQIDFLLQEMKPRSFFACHATWWKSLQDKWGIEKFREKIDLIFSKGDSKDIFDPSSVIQSFLAADLNLEIVIRFIASAFQLNQVHAWRYSRSYRPKPKYISEMAGVLSSALLISTATLILNLWEKLLADSRYEEPELVAWFLSVSAKASSHQKNQLKPIQEKLQARVNALLLDGPPKATDVSFEGKLSCSCKHCKGINDFLQSQQMKYILSEVQDIRKHVRQECFGREFPITMTDVKQGSPHKLVIEKTAAVARKKQSDYALLIELRDQLLET
jgi:2OG-Fe(II) oxygenase superfamily